MIVIRTLSLALLILCSACATTTHDSTISSVRPGMIERVFVDGPYGDIHVRLAGPAIDTRVHPPLILFHPTPYSGQFFEPFMMRMSTDRLVVAMDTPGYGDSQRPDHPLSIEAYASAFLEALDSLGLGVQGYDVLGYHTGTLVAAEVAIQSGKVRRLVLPGVPYFTGGAREDAFAKYAKPTELQNDGSHLINKWGLASIAIEDGLSLAQAQSNFGDMMQAFPDDWWAYHGVFSYLGEERLPKVDEPALLLTTSGSLRSETQAAAEIMPDARLQVFADIHHGLFDLHLDAIESATRAFLDN